MDQAALTGQSLPVKKFPGHIAFSGSTTKQPARRAGFLFLAAQVASLQHHSLAQVDQAALTGEHLPVKKFPGHIAFSGSTIKQSSTQPGATAIASAVLSPHCPCRWTRLR